MNKIYFVIPLFNEEDVLENSTKDILEKFEQLIISNKISSDSRILFVDDGSIDNSWNIIKELNSKYSSVKGIRLAKNSGQQNALYAGYKYAYNKCDAVISFDVDLQDDIAILDEMINRYIETECELVLITHNDRQKDTFFKKFMANSFYNVMKFLGVGILKNHSEFRLIDNVVIGRLLQYNEDNLFLRGIIPSLTNKICTIEVKRKERILGTPKYNFFSSLNLALNGITSLTIKPIRLIFLTGLIISLLSIFASTLELFMICIIGGLQIICIGVVGEYIAKINLQTKNRPKYFIEEEI